MSLTPGKYIKVIRVDNFLQGEGGMGEFRDEEQSGYSSCGV
jgi:hypothetical protein